MDPDRINDHGDTRAQRVVIGLCVLCALSTPPTGFGHHPKPPAGVLSAEGWATVLRSSGGPDSRGEYEAAHQRINMLLKLTSALRSLR
jgi:hypothetical protein